MFVSSDFIMLVCAAHSDTQAIYLYGTWGTEHQRPGSDLDIAVLLPPDTAHSVDAVEWFELSVRIAEAAHVEYADLINLHHAPMILRSEIIAANRRVYCADEYAADEFEMLTLSLYQKLNQERRGIVEEGLKSERFYNV